MRWSLSPEDFLAIFEIAENDLRVSRLEDHQIDDALMRK